MFRLKHYLVQKYKLLVYRKHVCLISVETSVLVRTRVGACMKVEREMVRSMVEQLSGLEPCQIHIQIEAWSGLETSRTSQAKMEAFCLE